jgi:hypothetical protein
MRIQGSLASRFVAFGSRIIENCRVIRVVAGGMGSVGGERLHVTRKSSPTELLLRFRLDASRFLLGRGTCELWHQSNPNRILVDSAAFLDLT